MALTFRRVALCFCSTWAHRGTGPNCLPWQESCKRRWQTSALKLLVCRQGAFNLPTPHSFLAQLGHKLIGYVSRKVDMILPHELFAAIYHCYKKAWVNRICPSRARVEKFWESVNGTIQFLTHPVRLRPNFRSQCIPLSIHGDGTPVVGIGKAWGKLLDIWSWQSLLVAGPTLLRTMLIFCVHTAIQSVKDGHNTLDVVFKKMASVIQCSLGG